jgi:hypothetical protein
MRELIHNFWKFIVLFLTPIAPLMLTIGIAVIADTIIGRKAAKKKAIDEFKDVDLEVTSRKTRDGLVPKLIGYQVAVITMFILDDYAINEMVMNFVPFAYLATKIVGGFLIWIEWTSINESYKKMHGITLNDLFVKYIKSLKVTVMSIIDFKKKLKDEE